MYKTGVYFGRFCPPHRGHLYQMIQASTRCEKLIVVISDNRIQTENMCREAGLPTITYQLRKQWILQMLQDMSHIVVRVLDETDILPYPDGWPMWTQRMRRGSYSTPHIPARAESSICRALSMENLNRSSRVK